MFLSLKISKKTIIALIAGIIVAGLLVASDVVQNKRVNATPTVSGKTAEERVEFLESFGWRVGEETECVTVVIPSVFNEVYTRYNDIQTANGFDLSKFKGKTATRYTYKILNYPEEIPDVYANVLVCDGKIIGGDVCTYAIDGFMHGFNPESETTGLMLGENALEYE